MLDNFETQAHENKTSKTTYIEPLVQQKLKIGYWGPNPLRAYGESDTFTTWRAQQRPNVFHEGPNKSRSLLSICKVAFSLINQNVEIAFFPTFVHFDNSSSIRLILWSGVAKIWLIRWTTIILLGPFFFFVFSIWILRLARNAKIYQNESQSITILQHSIIHHATEYLHFVNTVILLFLFFFKKNIW